MDEISADANQHTQSRRGKAFDMLVDLTDDDGALAEVVFAAFTTGKRREKMHWRRQVLHAGQFLAWYVSMFSSEGFLWVGLGFE